jgi:hypothetical protein
MNHPNVFLGVYYHKILNILMCLYVYFHDNEAQIHIYGNQKSTKLPNPKVTNVTVHLYIYVCVRVDVYNYIYCIYTVYIIYNNII